MIFFNKFRAQLLKISRWRYVYYILAVEELHKEAASAKCGSYVGVAIFRALVLCLFISIL